MSALAIAALVASAGLQSTPNLGMAEGRCRSPESGPAIVIEPHGLKDRRGLLRAELYPANDEDFLADDNILIEAGKTFRRSEIALPIAGAAPLCIRVPAPGTYTLVVLHDRDSNHKFSVLEDGIGFPGNPRLGMSKPPASKARIIVGEGITHAPITLNYHRGLFGFGPVGEAK